VVSRHWIEFGIMSTTEYIVHTRVANARDKYVISLLRKKNPKTRNRSPHDAVEARMMLSVSCDAIIVLLKRWISLIY